MLVTLRAFAAAATDVLAEIHRLSAVPRAKLACELIASSRGARMHRAEA
jgi:hypothetical protein